MFKLMNLQTMNVQNLSQKTQPEEIQNSMAEADLNLEHEKNKTLPPQTKDHPQNFLKEKSSPPPPNPPKEEKSKSSSFSVPEKPVGKTWENFVHAVKQVNGFLGALLEHTFILKEDEKVISLALPEKMSFLMNKLKERKNIERTENFLKTFWSDNRQIKLKVLEKSDMTEDFSPKAINEKARIEKGKEESNHISAHPLVLATEEVFKDHIKRTGLY